MSCYDKSFGVESIGFCCAFPLSQYEVADEICHDKLQKMSHLGLTKISIHLFNLEDRMCENQQHAALTVKCCINLLNMHSLQTTQICFQIYV